MEEGLDRADSGPAIMAQSAHESQA
jgi:hypothetical protein